MVHCRYAYTFMMTGLKPYHCSTCLLSFGCMSAVHHCPHCRAEVPYHPKDYHMQVRSERKFIAVFPPDVSG